MVTTGFELLRAQSVSAILFCELMWLLREARISADLFRRRRYHSRPPASRASRNIRLIAPTAAAAGSERRLPSEVPSVAPGVPFGATGVPIGAPA